MSRHFGLFFTVVLFRLVAYGQTPTITANGIQDAATYTVDIAPGSIFVVKGANLSGGGFSQASFPLPTTLNEVQINFTPVSGGAAIPAYMVYTYNVSGVNQLAAILPSTAAPGAYNVTVSRSGQVSAAQRAMVVARKFGLITVDSTGSGLAVAQNFISAAQLDLNRLTTGTVAGFTYSPAKPGQTIIAYGTGIGGLPSGADNTAPGVVDFRGRVDVKVFVGGVTITPDYAGRAPQFPGEDQVNFALPANVPTGCSVPFQVSVGGQFSNPTTLAIAPAGANACVSSRFNEAVLSRLDQGGTFTTAEFILTTLALKLSTAGITIDSRTETAGGAFTKYTGAQLGSADLFFGPPDTCQFYRRRSDPNGLFGGLGMNLNAGDSVRLTGPNNLNLPVERNRADNSYFVSVTSPGVGTPSRKIVAGEYRLTSTQEVDVKAFQGIAIAGEPIQLSADLPATVSRSRDLTVSWSGPGPTDLVVVLGASGVAVAGTDPTIYDWGAFVCSAPADRKTFTVPASILSQLPVTPPNGLITGTGLGELFVGSSTRPVAGNGLFTAGLTAGGNVDNATFVVFSGSGTVTEYQ